MIYESESGPLGAVIDEVREGHLDPTSITSEVSIKTSVPQNILKVSGNCPVMNLLSF